MAAEVQNQGGSGTEPETGTVGTVFPETESGPEPPEPFHRNRNRPSLLNCTETQKNPLSQRNRQNRKPEPLEPFHPQTVTEPNWGLPAKCFLSF